MYLVTKFLILGGIKVSGRPLWVSPLVYWDVGFKNAIQIGDRCVISHGVRLLTHDFSLDRVAEMKYGIQDYEYSKTKGIIIGDCSFIGMGAIILPGITIGAGSIIGSGSVVTRNVPDGVVYAGNPAKFIKTTEQFWLDQHTEWDKSKRRF